MADFNIKEKIDEIVDKIKSDKNIKEKFEKNPIGLIEELIGIDLPDDKIKQLIDGIKGKLAIDDIGDKLGDIGGKLGGLFGKK